MARRADGCLGNFVTRVANAHGPVVDLGRQRLVEDGDFRQGTDGPAK